VEIDSQIDQACVVVMRIVVLILINELMSTSSGLLLSLDGTFPQPPLDGDKNALLEDQIINQWKHENCDRSLKLYDGWSPILEAEITSVSENILRFLIKSPSNMAATIIRDCLTHNMSRLGLKTMIIIQSRLSKMHQHPLTPYENWPGFAMNQTLRANYRRDSSKTIE